LLLRVLALVGTVVVSAVIASQTERGRQVTGFLKDAQVEVRKVVWPTRQEAIQTTAVVLVVVLVAALFLWALDAGLSKLIRLLMGG
jgi:preprotein translocase subunit SecE